MIKIFLDIDGVLNNDNNKLYHFHSFAPSGAKAIYEPSMRVFKKFLDNIGKEYKIILTSTWQKDIKENSLDGIFMMDEFKSYDIKINDFTSPIFPRDFDKNHNEYRGKCIKRFIEKNDKIIIFDDMAFDLQKEKLSNHFIQINPKKGLCWIDCLTGLFKLNS